VFRDKLLPILQVRVRISKNLRYPKAVEGPKS
jgi:hypothetical protein